MRSVKTTVVIGAHLGWDGLVHEVRRAPSVMGVVVDTYCVACAPDMKIDNNIMSVRTIMPQLTHLPIDCIACLGAKPC